MLSSIIFALLPLILIIAVVAFITRLFSGTNHPMFDMIDKKVIEFKNRIFTSEEEKQKAKEQFKAELITWKGTMDLKKQEILWRSRTVGTILLKKNIELIDNIQAKIQQEIDSLN